MPKSLKRLLKSLSGRKLMLLAVACPALASAFLQFPATAQQQRQQCPTAVSVKCPREVETGTTYQCTAEVTGGTGEKLTYSWALEPPATFSPKRTATINVKTAGLGGRTITSTARVSVSQCQTLEGSGQTEVKDPTPAPQPILAATIDYTMSDEEKKARLQNVPKVAERVGPRSTIAIINFPGRDDTAEAGFPSEGGAPLTAAAASGDSLRGWRAAPSGAQFVSASYSAPRTSDSDAPASRCNLDRSQQLAAFAQEYLVKQLRINPDRITRLTGRPRPHPTVMVYVVPAGGRLPNPNSLPGASNPAMPDEEDGPADRPSNGISLGRPKVFDNRTLTLMLENLSENLRGIQGQFINQQSLAAALAFLQGSRSSEVVRSLSVTALTVPSLKREETTNTGLVTEEGAPLPDTTTTKTTSERGATTPAAPALDTPPAFSGFSPTFGPNASDLLSDQVNLTYQIFNLRMLLERSLSDRLLEDGNPRRQAVLGVNVTLDPPRTAEDSVAVVEIRLRAEGAQCATNDCLSLVSLMPQEKTYNAAALSTKSNAFGGAAVVNMFQVGYSERRRGQVFYLYRDNDTISYERMDSERPGQIVFGWMFRPVLGRRSVSPGLRQMFAIVSLPSGDKLGAPAASDLTRLRANVTTYWKKYDKDTMTSFTEREASRASRFRNALTFGLTKPEIFAPRYTNTAQYRDIEVKPTEDYQKSLAPGLRRAFWRLTGQKSVVVSVEGDNFFTGTQVIINDKNYATSADGLTLKSNQSFDLTTTLEALANGPGAIVGRYGMAVPMTLRDGARVPNGSLAIESAVLDPPAGGRRTLRLELRKLIDPEQPLTLDTLPRGEGVADATPLLSVNGNVVTPPYQLINRYGKTYFHEADFREDAPSLVARLTGGEDPLTVYMRRQFALATQQLLKRYADDAGTKGRADVPHDLLTALVGELNKALKEGSLHQHARAAGVKLSGEAEAFLGCGPQGDDLIRVNRLLIEHVYSDLVKKRVTLISSAPESFVVKDGGVVKVTYPFLPESWTASLPIPNPDADFQVTRLGGNSVLILTRNQLGFTLDPNSPDLTPQTRPYCWQLFLPGGGKLALKTEYCQPGDEGTVSLSNYAVTITAKQDIPEKLLLVSPAGAVFTLDVPKSPATAAPDAPKPIDLTQNDAVWITVTVKDPSKVASVEANQQALRFLPSPPKGDEPAKTIQVFIPRSVTEKAGGVDLTVTDKEGKISTVRLNIVGRPGANEGGKQ